VKTKGVVMRELIELFVEYERADAQRKVAEKTCSQLLEKIKTLAAREDYNNTIRRMLKLIEFESLEQTSIRDSKKK